MDGAPPIDFRYFKAQRPKLYWLDRPRPALQDDTFLLLMTSDGVIWSAILDFTIFLKSQKVTEIDAKSSQNIMSLKYTKLLNSCNCMRKLEKIQEYVQKVVFWPNLLPIKMKGKQTAVTSIMIMIMMMSLYSAFSI